MCIDLILAVAVTTLVDFTSAGPSWRANREVSALAAHAAGLTFLAKGEDPWLFGPAVTLPARPKEAKRIVLTLACEPTTCDAAWRLYYAQGAAPFSEAAACSLHPVGGAPHTRFTADLPADLFTSGSCRFRLDPPGTGDSFTVKKLSACYLVPRWTYVPRPPPEPFVPTASDVVLAGNAWELRQSTARIGAFSFRSRGKTVENHADEPWVCLDRSGAVRMLDWSSANVKVGRPRPHQLLAKAELKDGDDRLWKLERTFEAAEGGSALAVTTRISAESPDGSPAQILHLPALSLLVDRNSRGHKHQALLAGVEYLGDEPSSNRKEIRSPEHNRLIPAAHRLSAPIAAFTDERNYLAVTWQADEKRPFSVVFDTPDRLFSGGGHLLAFWAPEVGECRRESELNVYSHQDFTTATLRLVLHTGEGATIADVLSHVVTPEMLPAQNAVDDGAALELLAQGWLDSAIRNGTKVRHAIGSGFTCQSVCDAPVLMKHLASALAARRPAADPLVHRLRRVSDDMLNDFPEGKLPDASVSHIRLPAPVLVAGNVEDYLDRRRAELGRLTSELADGTRRWVAKPGKADFAETLGSDHCNGYTSISLLALMRAAVWSGDETAVARALAVLDEVNARYYGTIPCGAQPWEIPLHAPDIVASANLVQSFSLGYLLKPDPAYLSAARYWAYAGLSMVYLNPACPYATCAVMGATEWMTPNWIGRPVQWCGLVYAAALWDLARLEPLAEQGGYWRRIAAGITASGLRQTHPADDREAVGCLPDSWDLVRHVRYPVPINPGTVQENYAEALGKPYYAVRALGNGALVHVPGKARPFPLEKRSFRVEVDLWPESPCRVVATRCARPESVTLDGKAVDFRYLAGHRAVVMTLPALAKGLLEILVRTD